MICRSILALVIIASSILIDFDLAQAARLKSCILQNGDIVSKRRCRAAKGETQLSLALLSSAAQGPQGPQGSTGPQGVAGPAGPKGPQGSPGVSSRSVAIKNSTVTMIGIGNQVGVTATCPSGKVPLGGGCLQNTTFVTIGNTVPTSNGWSCSFRKATSGSSQVSLNAYAICAVVN